MQAFAVVDGLGGAGADVDGAQRGHELRDRGLVLRRVVGLWLSCHVDFPPVDIVELGCDPEIIDLLTIVQIAIVVDDLVG